MAVFDLTFSPSPAQVRMLGASTVLSIATIAVFWAPEMGDQTPARGLAMSLGWFVMNGGADAHPGAVRVWNRTTERGPALVRPGREVGRRLGEEASRLGKHPDEILANLLAEETQEVIFLTREAILAYCDGTGLDPPSFWLRPAPAQAPPEAAAASPLPGAGEPRPGGIVAQLTNFLNAAARMSKQTAYDSCVTEFGSDAFTWREFYEARAAADPSKKLRQGKKK